MYTQLGIVFKLSWICIQFVCILIIPQVIEHVANPAEFCKSLSALTVPDGATLISTINRSMRAYATAIIAAEYILHWVSIYSFSCAEVD